MQDIYNQSVALSAMTDRTVPGHFKKVLRGAQGLEMTCRIQKAVYAGLLAVLLSTDCPRILRDPRLWPPRHFQELAQ